MDDIKYVSTEQVQCLLSRAKQHSDRDWAVFTVMYGRGLRASEVARLQVADWRPESCRLYVHRVKGSLSGEYTVSVPEKKALASWLKIRGTAPGPLFLSRRGKGISRQMLDHLIKQYAPDSWPEDRRHCHTLRHAIAVHLLEGGADVIHVKDYLGHKSILSTMVYAAVTNPTRKRGEEISHRVIDRAHGGQADDQTKVRINWSKDRRSRRIARIKLP